ncbi:MAG: response regulator [Gemmatimonadaceae bacterium]|nr:response regulator [Gemmatimonadaceae bacterium]
MTPRPTPIPATPDAPPILVVDDDPLVRRTIVHALTAEGWPVLDIGSPLAASAIVTPIRALVTDMHMPELDGYELASTLRARHPGLPTLILSGSHGARVGVVAGAGPVTFLPKPFRAPTLRRCIRALLDAAAVAVS